MGRRSGSLRTNCPWALAESAGAFPSIAAPKCCTSTTTVAGRQSAR